MSAPYPEIRDQAPPLGRDALERGLQDLLDQRASLPAGLRKSQHGAAQRLRVLGLTQQFTAGLTQRVQHFPLGLADLLSPVAESRCG